MEKEKVEIKVKKILSNVTNIPYEELDNSKSLIDDIGLSSIEMMETISMIEGEFDIEISDLITQELVYIGDLIEYTWEESNKTKKIS